MKQVLENAQMNQLVYNALSFGAAVMLGAFVYFLTQIKSVAKQYKMVLQFPLLWLESPDTTTSACGVVGQKALSTRATDTPTG